ncbi:MAG: DUF935 family protein [Thermodesulfobacteriota bacterium]
MGTGWLNEGDRLEFGEGVNRTGLSREIATRTAAWDWTGLIGILPDPDPVLRRLPDGGVDVLERLTADAHLISVIQSRKLGTLRKDWRWEPGTVGEDEPTPEAERLRDDLAADLERVDLYALLSGVLDAPLYGMTPIELLWERPRRGENRLRLADLQVKPARWFGFDADNRPRFMSQRAPWEGEELPFGKFVFARHFPTYDNPYGLRLLSRCFWPVTFKKGGVKFWVTLAEKYGMPFLVGKYGQGATPEQQAELLSALTRMVQDAVAVIPDNGSVELLTAGGSAGSSGSSGSSGIHSGLKTAMDAEISKVIAGQTLTAEVGETGSYAAAKTHQEILGDYRAGDERLAKTTMEEIAWLYGLVNAPGVPPPVFRYEEEEEAKKEMAERDKTLTETGVKFRKTYYVRQYGLQEDDFDLGGPGSGDQGPGVGDRGAEAGDEGEGHADPGAEFAEGESGVDTPDAQAARLDADAAPHLAGMVDAIRGLVDQAESLEDLQARLLGAYPALDSSGLAQAMTEALAAAALAGRFELLEEV